MTINRALAGLAPSASRNITIPEPTKARQRFTTLSPPQRPTPANTNPNPTPSPTPSPTLSPKPTSKPSESPSPRPTRTTVSPAPRSGPVELPLDAYFNNIGVTSNKKPTLGNIDGAGASFSSQALARDGVRPGGLITYDGIHFSWPDAAAGKADNVTASGQTLAVHGAGTRLAFLLTAGWGPANGTATVLYSGGSTQKFTIGAPDWYLDCQGAGAPDVVAYTHFRNQGNGTVAWQSCLYYASIQLRSARSVKSITLPDISPPQPRNGDPSLHIFAITIS